MTLLKTYESITHSIGRLKEQARPYHIGYLASLEKTEHEYTLICD